MKKDDSLLSGIKPGLGFSDGTPSQSDAPIVTPDVRLRDLAKAYNNCIRDLDDMYTALEPVTDFKVLVRYYHYVPTGTVLAWPTMRVLQQGKVHSARETTILVPFPFQRRAVVIAAHPTTGLAAGDEVILPLPTIRNTPLGWTYDTWFVHPDSGLLVAETLDAIREVRHFGYGLVNKHDIEAKIRKP
ncbi:MAG: hypothetical protein D6746_10875 [Bacteroidetes bacterium]|nr:MAG: hypothetical protein D6746_10875 [Bacteroidota bacterium]